MGVKPGDKFGEWTVLAEADNPRYVKCMCSCGVVRDVYKSSLLLGKSLSCGHVEKERRRREVDKKVLGKKFGRLRPMARASDTPLRYRCKCDCGEWTDVACTTLLAGNVRSCGCLRREVSKNAMDKIEAKGIARQKELCVEGTALYNLTEKLSKNSSTGVKGVSRLKKGGYRAYITLKRKYIHLGEFATLEEAAQARADAEKKYFQPIIDKYSSV